MIICARQPSMFGQPAMSPAAHSSPTPHGTTSASSKANLDHGDAITRGRIVPYTVFITPELARVGMTEAQAHAEGRNVAVAKIPVSAIPRAKTLHDTTGTWQAVVDADSDLILGAALLGHNAGEVISTLQMAMLAGLPYQQVRDAVITHPTMAEGLNLLFDALDDQRRQTPSL
jgi:pyruvate/2-oxoglutarate dehydrogenase complex dihydrolipoamide dehydrogenase (E3) component